MAVPAPKLFISYSHDSEVHKDWVLMLATRLVANGVDVVLDQWDLALGSDLARFMESGLTEADRVLSICTSEYTAKANAGIGGVGYEKMILTAQTLKDVTTSRVIPLIRQNDSAQPIPTFLGSRVFIDFRDDLAYEAKYGELLREIHGKKVKPRPALGKNPFLIVPESIAPIISFGPERYVSPGLTGVVAFDYSNNNGRYVLGSGDMAFETAWSGGSNTSIHAYSDPPSIRSVALALGVKAIAEITDASLFDTSSRVRTPQLGEIAVWQNTAGYYAATRIDLLEHRGHGSHRDHLTFSYVIQPDKTSSFLSR